MKQALKKEIEFANHSGPVIPEHAVLDKSRFDSIGLDVAVIKLTPKLAEHWLNFRPENQRGEKSRLIDRLSADMKAGWWCDNNGETIKFDKEGKLIDGQHRVLSVFRTGESITTLVVFGCDSTGIETIDAGQNRSFADVFKIYGITNANKAAAITTAIMALEKRGHIGAYTPSRKAALDFALKNGNAIQRSVQMGSKIQTWLPISTAGALHYLYAKVDEPLANNMVNEFIKPKNDRSNAIQTLKRMMNKLKEESLGKSFQSGRYWKTAIAIKAFNSYFLCQEVSVLRYTKSEKYPRIVDTSF